MKPSSLLTALIFSASLVTAHAQPGAGGGMPGSSGPNFSGSLGKLLGDNSAFSATMEMQTKGKSGDIIMPGKMAYDGGKSRFEVDMTKTQGTGVPANSLAQMKMMGMDIMVIISRPDKKANLLMYPGLSAYLEMPMEETEANIKLDKFKVETTDLGKETIDGHACVKKKAVVTDEKGETHESTVWNATDLKDFPIKVIQNEKGGDVTMTFKDVKLSKPEAATFDAPSGFTKYTDMMQMMMQEGAKKAQQRGGGR